MLRRKARRRKGTRRRLLDFLLYHQDRICEVHLALLLVGSVLALGAVHVPTLLVVSAFAVLGLLGVLAPGAPKVDAAPAAVGLLLAVYCLAQALPLPIDWVEALSPEHAEIYKTALDPFPGHARTASLTFDRGATLTESLKWVLYAVTFLLAGNVTQRSGRQRVCWMIFVSGTLLAAITLLHGIMNADRVFGFYEPTTASLHLALSPLVNPNNLAGYLNLASFTGLGLLLTERNKDLRRFMVIGLVMTMGQSVLSGSRGGALTLVLGAGMAWLTLSRFIRLRVDPTLTRRARTWALITFAAALITTFATGPAEVWMELRNTGIEKIALGKWTMELIPQFPWFGVGASSFEAVISRFSHHGSNVIFTNPENLPLAWLSEFGLPVGLLALGAFGWLLRNQAMGAASSVLAACSYVGIVAVLIQNLADLAFVVPGFVVAFCALVSTLRNHQDAPSKPERVGTAFPRRMLLPAAAGIFAIAWTSTAVWGHPNAESDRRALHRRMTATDFSSSTAKASFFRELKQAMVRHPADAYLRRLGTDAACRSKEGNAIHWASAALNLAPNDGRTHLLVGHILADHGVLHQALLQLRLAASHAPELTGVVVSTALAWTKDQDHLAQIVPAVPDGTDLLVRLGQRLSDDSDWESSVHFLEQALERDPRSTAARTTLVERLLTRTSRQRDPCLGPGSGACLHQIERSLEVLKAQTGKSSQTVRQRARLMALRGRVAEALALLSHECPAGSSLCVRESISLANEVGKPLEELARTLVALNCDDQAQCVKTHTWLANLYRSRGEPGTALKHSWQAAEQDGTAVTWLLTAREAEGLGSIAQAAIAAENARKLAPRNSKLSQEIAEVRERLSRNERPLVAPN